MSLVTYKGIQFDYINPTPEMVDVEDIIRSISRLNRFVGHSKRAYTVGEHTFLCLFMAELLGYSYREQLLVLLHDFTEAYVADMPAPLKKLIPEYSVIEERVEKAIYQHVGIEPPTVEEYAKIKSVDLTMLVIEMRDLTVHKWTDFISDVTHITMLDSLELVIDSNSSMSEIMLNDLLHECYEDLLVRLEKEQADAEV